MLFDRPKTAGRFSVSEIPYRGIKQTIMWMKSLASEGQTHARVRRHAIEVIRRVTPKDYLSEAAAIYYDVCRQIRYTRDPITREMISHPAVTLGAKAGDCDDMALLLMALLGALQQSVGTEAQFVTVSFNRSRSYSHVFLRVRGPDGRWLVLDPVAGPDTVRMLKKTMHHKAW